MFSVVCWSLGYSFSFWSFRADCASLDIHAVWFSARHINFPYFCATSEPILTSSPILPLIVFKIASMKFSVHFFCNFCTRIRFLRPRKVFPLIFEFRVANLDFSFHAVSQDHQLVIGGGGFAVQVIRSFWYWSYCQLVSFHSVHLLEGKLPSLIPENFPYPYLFRSCSIHAPCAKQRVHGFSVEAIGCPFKVFGLRSLVRRLIFSSPLPVMNWLWTPTWDRCWGWWV